MSRRKETPEKICDECRRTFLARAASLAGSVAGSALLASVLGGCETDVLKSSHTAVQVDVPAEPALARPGGGVKKTFPDFNTGRPVMILRVEAEQFVVLSTICTHQGCEVYLPGVVGPDIECPCHGSQYNPTTGAVIHGPAQAPLQAFPNSFDAASGVLTITF